MKSLRFIGISLLVIFTFVSCNDGKSKHTSIKTDKIEFRKDGELTFRNPEGPVLKKIDIEVAENSYDIQTGLMYRKSMKENRGMLFVFDDERPRGHFYMKNTYIPLDLVYINADKKIVDINENAKPLDESPLPSKAKAKYVLEINGGMVQKWNLVIGDDVSFQIEK